MPVKIALRYLDGRDKVALLNQVLDVAGLEAELEAMRKSLRKERGNYDNDLGSALEMRSKVA